MAVKRPMLWLSASFVAGMYLFAIFDIAVTFTVIFCALIAVIFKILKTKSRFDCVIYIISLLLFILSGIIYGITDDITQKPLYKLCGDTVTVTGEVKNTPITSDRYVRFDLELSSVLDANLTEEKTDETISFIYFKNDNSNSYPTLTKGDVITVQCVISLPDSAMNTGGFDYASYLKTQGIYFQATAEVETIQLIGHNTHWFADGITSIRNKCAALFDATFPTDESGLLKAYIIGDKSGIEENVSTLFSVTGLSHVLAVSGMHLAVFIAALTAFFRMIRLPKRRQMYLTIFAIIFFVLFTGASVSTIRAGLFCLIALFAELVFKRSDSLTTLAEVAAILLCTNPLIAFNASFLLSFSATLGIILFSERICAVFAHLYQKLKPATRRKKILKSLCDLIAVGISAQIFTIPVLIYLFGEFSIVTILATILITPLLAPALIGGLLFCALGIISQTIAYPFAGFVYCCAWLMIKVAQLFAAIPFAKIPFGSITPFLLLVYIASLSIGYFLFIRRNKAGYLISLYSVMMLCIVFLVHAISVYPTAKVSFINVGQGDCTLIQLPGNCDILIDAGGKENDYKTAENVVKPYLTQNGVYDIEYVFASHGHEDHVNGIIGLMDIIKIKNIVVPHGFGTTEEGSALLDNAEKNAIPVTYLKHGDMLKFNDKVNLSAIMPDDKILSLLTTENAENDRSLLLKFSYGDISFLFTGDMTQKAERYTVAHYSDLLKANVMKIAHHGAETSNTETFLNAVNPQYAYIPVGENYYKHPSKIVLNRLISNNIKYYRADRHNDVVFYLSTESIKGIRYNQNVFVGGSYELR